MEEDKEVSKWKQRRKLRSIYKQYKVGMIAWEDIDPEYQALLMKYYGVH